MRFSTTGRLPAAPPSIPLCVQSTRELSHGLRSHKVYLVCMHVCVAASMLVQLQARTCAERCQHSQTRSSLQLAAGRTPRGRQTRGPLVPATTSVGGAWSAACMGTGEWSLRRCGFQAGRAGWLLRWLQGLVGQLFITSSRTTGQGGHHSIVASSFQ